MAHWRWWCTMALVSGLWLARVASAADQEVPFAEGTLTSVDLNQDHPSITLRLSTGQPLILRLGRIGAWESLKVGGVVKLRYTEQGGVYTVESMQLVRPVQAAASATPGASPSPAPSPTTAVGPPDARSQAVGEQKKQDTTQPNMADNQREQATTDRQEKKRGGKKP